MMVARITCLLQQTNPSSKCRGFLHYSLDLKTRRLWDPKDSSPEQLPCLGDALPAQCCPLKPSR